VVVEEAPLVDEDSEEVGSCNHVNVNDQIT